jgi:Mrp family chromosome partitioning ATPase
VANRSGLANLLADGALTAEDGQAASRSVACELWSVAPQLWLLPSGPPPPHPAALLGSHTFRELLKHQRDQFDYLVVDCSPAQAGDAQVLAGMVDAVLVVADADETDRAAVTRLRHQLDGPGGRLIGAVLNRARGAGKAPRYRYRIREHL